MGMRDVSAWWYLAGGCLAVAALSLLPAPVEGKKRPRVFTNAPVPTEGREDGKLFHEMRQHP